MRALLALAIVLAPGIAAAQPAWAKLSAPEVLAKVDATYASAKGVSASFTQTVVNTTFGTTTVSTGTVYVARPDKMRWDYTTKKQSLDKSFIFDGTTLWVVEPANRQVLKHTVVSGTMPAAISFLTGGGGLTKEFTAKAPSAPNQHVPGAVVIELSPKQPTAQYTRLLLVIDPTAWTVARSIVTDANGASNTFEFAGVNLKAKHNASIFQFNPQRVPTYKVVTVAPPAASPTTSKKLPAPAPAKSPAPAPKN
ncbi:MAG: outer membrane lipoprotein carrier protein LolA [Deltaproteobacteria bacterium]|nr:outer membrane lipoprotein carrier protein LolA [Deltaproteobacteria bacterium]